MAKIIVCLAFLLFNNVFAAQQTEQDTLNYLDNNEITNGISYFDNRFRIDAQIDEIILIFYRSKGSPPVILVQPNGAKLKINDYPKDTMQWFDGISFDIIKIQKPTPGPWQVIGNILPKSKIMVISQIKLAAEPLPKLLLAGETLKITAQLYNGEHIIEQPAFRDVVSLDVDFYSTNNVNYGNFGADNVKLTSFRDDGKVLDEYAGDGIFTGEFDLTLAPGEWAPVYTIKLPMTERRLNQHTIIIQPSPVELVIDKAKSELDHHNLNFKINNKVVKAESMIFQGKVTYPNKQIESFSLLENEGGEDINNRILKIGYREGGMHRINVSAFGETVKGREFRLQLPELTFNAVMMGIVKKGPAVINEQFSITEKIKQQEVQAQETLIALKHKQKAEQAHQDQLQIYIIIAGNFILLIAIALGFWLYRRKIYK